MVADLITPAQVGVRMRREFTGAWLAQVEALCEDVSGLVRRIADGRLDEADHATVPPAIRRVCFEMVRRGVENPHALAQEGTDAVYRWQVADGQDTLYATEAEHEIIRDAVGLVGVGHLNLTTDMPLRLLHDADLHGPGFTLAHDNY